MAETAEMTPPQNRLLSALLLASVGALFYATLGAILTFLFFFLGWIPGALLGVVHGVRQARHTPLREAIVLFVGCAATCGVLACIGTSIPIFGIVGPVAGVLLRMAVQALGPVVCRQVAQLMGASFIVACLGWGVWYMTHPVVHSMP